MLYLAKHLVRMHLSSGRYFIIEFDLNAKGVVAGPTDIGRFQFGQGVAQRSVDTNGDVLTCELVFHGEWWPVRIPWSAIKHVLTGEQIAERKASAATHRGGQ